MQGMTKAGYFHSKAQKPLYVCIYMGLNLLFPALFLVLSLGKVIKVTDQSIDSILDSHPCMLIKFYSPACSHCQHLAPIYESAATIVAQSHCDAQMAEIDVTKQRRSAEKYDVHAYPTLILFVDGEPVERYKGTRTAEAIAEWLQTKEVEYLKEGKS